MSKTLQTQTTLEDFLRCSYPAVAVETHEESRLMTFLLDLTKQKPFTKLQIATVSASGKILSVKAASGDRATAQIGEGGYPGAFKYAAEKEDVLMLALDFQHIIKNGGAYRGLKDRFEELKARGSMVILAAPSWTMPPELEHDIPIVDFALPTREQLGAALDRVAIDSGVTTPKGEERVDLLDAMAGLTLQEAENATALSMAKTNGKFSAPLISNEKMRLIRSSGVLELAPPPPNAIGGLGEATAYIQEEVLPAKDSPLLQAKGIIAVGVPGTGKSLLSKIIAQMMRRPCLKMNFGALKGGIVGQSEGNMKRALKLADAVAPCVLWVDEVEKGVGGHASSDRSDGGVTSSMIGIWLEWLQEHTSPVFTVATCNDYSKLPTELTRAGRFDERFFVDLPTDGERAEIALIHLERFVKDPEQEWINEIVALSQEWTGAEIEQLCKSAARRQLKTGSMSVELIHEAAAAIRPISKVKEAEIRALREWAGTALRPANTKAAGPATGRKFRSA